MPVLMSALLAYFIGAVPTGLLVGRIGWRTDVRLHGSGNIGATNVGRVLGRRAGFLVLALDVMKGAAAVMAPVAVYSGVVRFPVGGTPRDSLLIVAAAAAVIAGNMFSIFIGGKGGKGVGVASGALLVMVPEIAVILLLVWLTVRTATKYVSLASLSIAALFPALMWVYHGANKTYLVFSLLSSVMVFYSHRANIKRLIAGEELKYDQKADKPV
ncbi:MAG: glycerol-3-phosphate 1-O-acyltransferase PlsY [Actinomycetota bacterium]|nr:glycerol-3-phosphate 1-O-acyltransferase PlsY [Actinomycetota bacterium]